MDEPVKLPASSYEEVAKIIAAYARADKEASLDDIARLTGMHRTMVSSNNGFLTSIGLIEGGNKKLVAANGKQLGLAIEHNQQEEIAAQWRHIASDNVFLRNLVSAVRIRKGMDAASLRAHVAYSAGLAKTKGVMTGTGTVIEILKVAGLLSEQDGKIIANSEVPNSVPDRVGSPSVTQTPPSALLSNANAPVSHVLRTTLPITIQVNISCDADDLDTLGGKLKKLLEDLEPKTEDSDE